MRKTKLIAATAGAVALATAAAACGSSSSSTGTTASTSSFNAGLTSVVNASTHQGGTLRMALTSDWDSPDPGNTYYAYSWDFMRLYGRSLVTWKQAPGSAGLQLVPDLATNTGDVSADGLTWTFHLQPGASYQDGTAIKPSDVKYAIERSNYGQDTLKNGPAYFAQVLQDTTSYKGPYLDKNPNDGVSGIVADDAADTITFHLKQKFSDFAELAALPSTVPVPQAKDTGADYYKNIIASGQYEIQNYTPGKSMTLVPNTNFKSSTDPSGIHKVTADKIVVQLNVSQDQIDQELLHGQLDVDLDGTGVGTTAQSQILANPTLKAQADDGYTNALTYMTINTTVKPFDNINCRQAVEYAVDKTTVQSALGGAIGGGDIASTLLTPNMAGYQQSNQYPSPGNQGDPSAAKTKLAACEAAEPSFFSNGQLTVNLSARADRPKEVNSAVAIQAALKLANINVNIDKFPSSTYFSQFAGNGSYVAAHSIALSMMKWGADWADVYGDLDQVITSAGIHNGGGSTNLGEYNSPAIDNLFQQYLSTTDQAKRDQYGAAIDRQAMKDAAVVPLVYNKALIFHPSTVSNWYLQPSFGEPDFSVLGVTGS
jgi:peptide/nickel transport system substrate-binding protein